MSQCQQFPPLLHQQPFQHQPQQHQLGPHLLDAGDPSHNQSAAQGGGPHSLLSPMPLFRPATKQPAQWFYATAPADQPELLNAELGAHNQPPSAGSPGLLAPHQLLARFGPRHCTESVEVPSSEHVAEIVGRQGCKIKALRAKTNTYIKTPVRGEEPVFVVTGRQEDVAEAKKEIECAAEHFTQIRASRRHSQGACPAPGHVTAYVRVPLRVVGLVVGPKGNTIKRIQQDTHTYIITPSREREPIFEVTGLPQNVEAARREIENHIYQRTGNMPITDPNGSLANYDLHVRAAALHAHHPVHQPGQQSQRPNYGALAAISSSARSFCGGGLSQPGPYQQAGKQQQMFGPTALANSGPPQLGLGSSASASNLHLLLGQLEMDSGNQQNQPAESKAQAAVQPLFRPAAAHQQTVRPPVAGGGPGSAFSPWHSSSAGPAGPAMDFLELLSQSPSPLFAASAHSAGSGSCALGHELSGTGGSGGLCSTHSSSRDEGLGDSPTNSFGRTDPYQHLMTIWADVCEDGSGGGGGKTAAVPSTS